MSKSSPRQHRLFRLVGFTLLLASFAASSPALAEPEAPAEATAQQQPTPPLAEEPRVDTAAEPVDVSPHNSADSAVVSDILERYRGLPGGPGIDTPAMPVAPSATAAPAEPIAPPPVTELTLVLEWSPGPQHAALLVAQERGLFSRRGLNVVLQTPGDPDVPAKLVAASQAELALTDQLTLHRLVDQGRPIIRVATLSELPLSALLVREDADIDTVLGLIDHRVGYAQRSGQDVLLRAILQHEGLNLSHVEAKDVHFSVVRAMNEGWIDAFIGGAALSLPRELADLGIATRSLPTETLGVPVHDGLVVVANQDHFQAQKDAIRAFVDALEDATRWIIDHPAASWEIMTRLEPTMDSPANAEAWPDIRRRLSLRPGAMDHGRYRRLERYLHDQKIVERLTPISRLGKDPG